MDSLFVDDNCHQNGPFSSSQQSVNSFFQQNRFSQLFSTIYVVRTEVDVPIYYLYRHECFTGKYTIRKVCR